MKVKKFVLWTVLVLSVLGFMASMLWFPWGSVIPAGIAAWMIVLLVKRRNQTPPQKSAKREKREKRNWNWAKIVCIGLMVLFAIATVLIAIFFGWWALVPAIALICMIMWLCRILGKSLLIATIALVIAILLFGVFAILSSVGVGVNVLNVDQINADELNVTDVNATNVNVTTLNATEVNVTKVNATEVNATKVNATEVNATKVNATEVNATKVNATEVNATKVNATEVNATKVNVTEVNATTTTTTKPTTQPTQPSTAPATKPTTPSTKPSTTPTTAVVNPAIKCATSIRYGETLYVNLEDIEASNLLVSNKMFVEVEQISDTRVAVTLTEDVDGYITITDSVSRVNVVIDIVAA